MKVFITGTMRAGTTLTAQILNQHPDLRVTYDSVHFMRFAYQKYGKNDLSLDAALQLGAALNQRLETRFRNGFDLAQYGSRVSALPKPSYSAVYDIIMQLYLGHRNWGEKTVLQWRNAADILEMFDDMILVHCVRDPRDVLSSWKKKTIAPGVDYLDAISNCYDSMKHATEHTSKFGKRYYVLKFEDLAREPERAVRALCNALGISFAQSMLDATRYKNKVTQETWQPNTVFNDQIEGISAAPVNRWKEHLEKEDLLLCELVNREYMHHFGYELSGELAHADIRDLWRAFAKIQQSPLALNGLLNVVHRREGVQRNPLDESDPSTWVTDVKSL